MERNDADYEVELKRDLSSLRSAPQSRKGFSDELRKKIEERIDEKERRAKPWVAVVGALGVFSALVAFAFVFVMAFDWSEDDSIITASLQNSSIALQQLEPAYESAAYDDGLSFRSGLLIGLRADDKKMSYRTLYIAPKDSRPAVVAQGSGIIVPYKRDFWRLDELRYDTVTDHSEFIVSRPADQRAPEARTIAPKLFADNPKEKVNLAEKILFAANEYVSIGETREVSSDNGSTMVYKAWTTTIPSLAADRKHVTLNDVLDMKMSAYEYVTDEWKVVRSQGRWLAMVAEWSPMEASSLTPSAYRKANVQLPRAVINHDEPCCSWDDILAKFPGAKDVLTSPGNDMTIVVADDLLLVYGNPSTFTGKPALTVKLDPKETIIMAQWATDFYVDEWAQKTSQLLR